MENHNLFVRDLDIYDGETLEADQDIGSLHCVRDKYGRVQDFQIEAYHYPDGKEVLEDINIDSSATIHPEEDDFRRRAVPYCFSERAGKEEFFVSYADQYPEGEILDRPALGERWSHNTSDRAEQEEERRAFRRVVLGVQETYVRVVRGEPLALIEHGEALLGDDSRRQVRFREADRGSRFITALSAPPSPPDEPTRLVRCWLVPDEDLRQATSGTWPSVEIVIGLRGDGLPSGEDDAFGALGGKPFCLDRTGFFRLKENPASVEVWTNLYGVKTEVMAKLCLWRRGFRASCGYRIDSIQSFKN